MLKFSNKETDFKSKVNLTRGDFVIWHNPQPDTALAACDWRIGKVTSIGGMTDCPNTDVGVHWYGTVENNLQYLTPMMSKALVPLYREDESNLPLCDILKLKEVGHVVLEPQDVFSEDLHLSERVKEIISACVGFDVAAAERDRMLQPQCVSNKFKKEQGVSKRTEISKTELRLIYESYKAKMNSECSKKVTASTENTPQKPPKKRFKVIVENATAASTAAVDEKPPVSSSTVERTEELVMIKTEVLPTHETKESTGCQKSEELMLPCMRGVLCVENNHNVFKGLWDHANPGATSSICTKSGLMFDFRSVLETAPHDFPHSGAYCGYFMMLNSSGQEKKIEEKKVQLCFNKKTDNTFDVLGAGTNCFGKFKMHGTLLINGRVELKREYGFSASEWKDFHKTLCEMAATIQEARKSLADQQEEAICKESPHSLEINTTSTDSAESHIDSETFHEDLPESASEMPEVLEIEPDTVIKEEQLDEEEDATAEVLRTKHLDARKKEVQPLIEEPVPIESSEQLYPIEMQEMISTAQEEISDHLESSGREEPFDPELIKQESKTESDTSAEVDENNEEKEEIAIWDTKEGCRVEFDVPKCSLAEYLMEHPHHECYIGQDSQDYEVPLWNMKKNERDKRKIARKRMEKALSSRPHLRPYCNQDRQQRILMWDTTSQKIIDEEFCPKRKKIARYLEKFSAHEIYFGQDQERVMLWDMKRQKKIPGPRKSELVTYLLARPTHEVYQRQEKRQRVFLWNPVGSGDRIMVDAKKVKELLEANPTWDHYHNQDQLNRVPIWDQKTNSRVRYEAWPTLENLQIFLRLHPEVELYTLQDKEELDRKQKEREEREQKAREEAERRAAERAAVKALLAKVNAENPIVRIWDCFHWREVDLHACPRWSVLVEYLVSLPDHSPYEGQDDPEYPVPLFDKTQKVKLKETVLHSELEDFLKNNLDKEIYSNQDGKEKIQLYDSRSFDLIPKKAGPTRLELQKWLLFNKHFSIAVDENVFVDISLLPEKPEVAPLPPPPPPEAQSKPHAEEQKQTPPQLSEPVKSPLSQETKTINKAVLKEKKAVLKVKKGAKRKEKAAQKRVAHAFRDFLYFDEVINNRNLQDLEKYKSLNHGHGVTMTIFSAKDFRRYMAWKDARTKREEQEKEAKEKAKKRKTNTSVSCSLSSF